MGAALSAPQHSGAFFPLSSGSRSQALSWLVPRRPPLLKSSIALAEELSGCNSPPSLSPSLTLLLPQRRFRDVDPSVFSQSPRPSPHASTLLTSSPDLRLSHTAISVQILKLLPACPCSSSSFKKFLKMYLFIFREGGGKERGRESSVCGCLPCAPHWRPGPKPRHVP